MKAIALAIAASLAIGGSASAATKPNASECMTLDKLKSVIKGAKITQLNIGQFNYGLGAFDATTPAHTPLPDADHAVILTAGKNKNILIWMKGDCALETPPMPLGPEFAAHLKAIHPTSGETSDAPDTSSDLHL